MKVKFKKLDTNSVAPFQANPGDAGFDLTVSYVKKIGLFKYEYGSGIAVEIPKGFEGQVRSRSSIHKTGLILSNGIGTIDSGYRGEIKAVFWKIPFIGKKYAIGERFCQLVINSIPKVEYIEKEELSESERGTGGYGSSGK